VTKIYTYPEPTPYGVRAVGIANITAYFGPKNEFGGKLITVTGKEAAFKAGKIGVVGKSCGSVRESTVYRTP
jgi:starvation-inducible outer membrane lipoprotein